jgi:hypothetical protein
MKFCPVAPEICRGHVHVAKKERRIIIIIIIINEAKTISLQTTFGRLNKPCQCRNTDYWTDDTLKDVIVHQQRYRT